MQLPENKGVTSRYLSLAPHTTAQFFRLNPEMQGPVTTLCGLLGKMFPGSQVSMTAVYSFTESDLRLVIGVSAPLNEENAELVDHVMEHYFQPLMEKIASEHNVLVALGENLGSHSARYNTARPLDALASMEDRLDNLEEAGPLGRLLAASLPLYEEGCGNDLQRVFKAANTESPIQEN